MKELIVVLGYGSVIHERMKRYLQKVAEYISKSSNDLVVITTGWQGEAEMMSGYLKQIGVKVPILSETKARTTKENLVYSKGIIEEKQLTPELVTIFCDKIRKFKIRFLAKRVLDGFSFQIISYPLTTNLKGKIKQILIGTPIEIISYYFPLIERLKIKIREGK